MPTIDRSLANLGVSTIHAVDDADRMPAWECRRLWASGSTFCAPHLLAAAWARFVARDQELHRDVGPEADTRRIRR